ncbi:hypothetical protein AVEN_37759-1 [Araneus ventricosus]|uniref:Uncharacterized protein n=1 Tax=Araneus ventricosus TaxID=182803 RepID=A0A4Y2BSX8_ARAVE|nr:hypothetical protein AVEN_37759-1 [Araneus ventricosus]
MIINYFDLKDLNSVTAALAIAVGSYFLFKIIHEAFKSYDARWKRHPGPIGLPLVGYLPFLGKEPHKTLWRMKGRYGNMIGKRQRIISQDFDKSSISLSQKKPFWNYVFSSVNKITQKRKELEVEKN